MKLLKENVAKNMGDSFEVNVRENRKPTLKLLVMCEEMEEEELIG